MAANNSNGNKNRIKKVEVTASVVGPDVETTEVLPEERAGQVKFTEGTIVLPRSEKPLPWWRRLFGGSVRSRTVIDAEQMEELRRSVMEELRSRNDLEGNGGGRVAGVTSSRPFERVMLPEGAGASNRGHGGGDWLFGGFVVVALVAIVVLLLLGGRASSGPEGALAELQKALDERDMEAFNNVVDVPVIAESVVQQAYPEPVVQVMALPAQLRPTNVSASGTIAADVVKPGLVATLVDDLNEAVAVGEVPMDGTSLLRRLWLRSGGDEIQVGKPKVVSQQDGIAVAEALVTRRDSGLVAEVLKLKLEERDNHWMVVDMPNIGPVMTQLASLGSGAKPADEVLLAAPVLSPTVATGGVEPANGTSASVVVRAGLVVETIEKDSTNAGPMMVKVAMKNTADHDFKRVMLRVILGDARGEPLRIIELEDSKAFAAGASRTRELSVPVNRKKNLERQVAELPLSALTVRAEVIAVE